MAISATESFLTQLGYAAQGKSLAEVWNKSNLIEFENLISSKAEESEDNASVSLGSIDFDR